MPRLFRSLPPIALAAVLAGACARSPVVPSVAPVPALVLGIGGGQDGGGAVAADGEPRATPRAALPGATPGDSPARPAAAGTALTAADVSTETARVFGDSAPPPASDTAVAPGVPVWDIDVHSYETVARVEDYVRIFSGRAKGVFSTALQRQTQYGPMIRDRLRQAGLPENFTYLALVESWFNPHAYSKAAAVGVWQFMAGTARGAGLRVDWWVDERRDPVRSTEAAARMLSELRNQFGSLYLAAAAYNGGSGRVSRGLARYSDALDGIEGDDRFFALAEQSYLRPETRDYVPKIIAAALVGEEPARYGVTVESLPPYAYDSVRAPGGTPLAAVANASGVTPAEISELNAALLRGMTPPADSMWVRVPVGRAAEFEERFDALDPAERKAVTRVESKKGQSMVSIARKHGITAKQLGWYNARVTRLKSGALRTGQLILVPRKDVVALARDVPNPSIEKYPKRRSSRASKARPTAKKSAAKSSAKKPTAKASVKKPVAKSSAKKPSAKPAAKPTAKKLAAKPTAKQPVAKSTAKKPAAKKPAAKKPAAKKPAARSPQR